MKKKTKGRQGDQPQVTTKNLLMRHEPTNNIANHGEGIMDDDSTTQTEVLDMGNQAAPWMNTR
jgi:hypothetical protein